MNVRPTNGSGMKGAEGVGNHARAIGPEKWINDALPSPVSTPKTATPSEFLFHWRTKIASDPGKRLPCLFFSKRRGWQRPQLRDTRRDDLFHKRREGMMERRSHGGGGVRADHGPWMYVLGHMNPSGLCSWVGRKIPKEKRASITETEVQEGG